MFQDGERRVRILILSPPAPSSKEHFLTKIWNPDQWGLKSESVYKSVHTMATERYVQRRSRQVCGVLRVDLRVVGNLEDDDTTVLVRHSEVGVFECRVVEPTAIDVDVVGGKPVVGGCPGDAGWR